MGKWQTASKVGSRPNEQKYGMALYGAAWPEGDYYYVCGGGGHGLVPRVVWAEYKNGRCSDQLGDYKLGKETPMRMLMCPWGSSLLLGNASGGIRRLQIGTEDAVSQRPKLVEVSAAFQEVMTGLKDEVACMTFNSRGHLLGVGFRESGAVKIVAYPSMKTLVEWRLRDPIDPEVKDIDFCPTAAVQQALQQQGQQQQHVELVATVGGHGACQIWEVSQDNVAVVAKLELPKASGWCVPEVGPDGRELPPKAGLAKARFIRCRFARNGQLLLFALINVGRDASFLAAFGPPTQPEQPWQLLKKVKAKDSPASAMDISKNGEWVAVGFADGAMRVFNTGSLLVRGEAEASIAFVSSVTFNGDNTAVLAVGGDANCYVMELVPRRQAGGSGTLRLLLFVLLVAAAALLLHYWQHPEALPYSCLQWLQQWSKHEDVVHACSSGSSVLHEHVCEWVQRAGSVLPDDAMYGQHEEL